MKIIAIAVFAVVIIMIMTERVHRMAAALAGAMVLLLLKVMTAQEALSFIDFNTIGVLVGMMLFVAVVKNSGLFEYIAIKSAKMVKGDPWKIMVAFVLITAVLSAVLDNVTTVLLVGPMTIAIARMLQVDPVPYLMMQILASNVGGTATLIGDPPNIMIGSEAGLSFTDFLTNTGVAVVLVLIAQLLLMKFLFQKKVESGEIDTSRVMKLDEKKSVTDPRLMRLGVIVMGFVILGFMLHDKLGMESSIIALSAGAFMLIAGRQNVEDIVSEVEWPTILFFMCLFVVVGGLQKTGVIKSLSELILELTDGHDVMMMLVLLWASALLSSVLDNIPFVATMIPLILSLEQQGINVTPLWWAISLGACLGGNGTMIGASANVVLSDISNKHGYPITFKSYLKVGFPFMLISVAISMCYMLIRYAA